MTFIIVLWYGMGSETFVNARHSFRELFQVYTFMIRFSKFNVGLCPNKRLTNKILPFFQKLKFNSKIAIHNQINQMPLYHLEMALPNISITYVRTKLINRILLFSSDIRSVHHPCDWEVEAWMDFRSVTSNFIEG